MSTPNIRHDGPVAAASSMPEDSVPPDDVHGQSTELPSRAELRDRALQSRSSYELGKLPGEEEGTEIDRALQREAENESRLGMAFLYLVVEDIPDKERIGALQEHLGNANPNPAIGLRQHLDALRFGILPKGPSMARQIAARMRSVMRKHDFSASTHAVLDRNIAALEKIAEDTDLIEDEQLKAEVAERSVEDRLKGCSGVYVFTYPHYLRHPTHQSTESETMLDRTLLKVGFTDKDILERVNHETSGAGVPEHRRILRAYLLTEDNGQSNQKIERQFHDLLDSAGHAGPKRGSTEHQKGGKEWFYTNVDFLDRVATLLKLEIVETDSAEYEL